jgi:hypothetical protein
MESSKLSLGTALRQPKINAAYLTPALIASVIFSFDLFKILAKIVMFVVLYGKLFNCLR